MNSVTNFSIRPTRRRRTAEEREALVAQARRMRAEGMKMAAIVSELGVTAVTLARWFKEASPAPTFLPVQLVGPSLPSGGGLALVTPAGFRLEGLSLEAAVAVLRQLG